MERGFCIGVFDGCHIGHLRLIERASQQCEKLAVAVVEDEAVRKQKGESRPMFPFAHRFAIIKALRWTNCAVASEGFDPYDAFVLAERHMGPIGIFFKGEDQDHIDTRRLEERGVSIVTLPRTSGVSSTEIIKKLRSQAE
jgi:glycerol-3-phosphate cytidylyltransferase